MDKKKDCEYEICVICHKKLNIKKETSISEREFYIEGAGQLCIDCYMNLFQEKRISNDH